MKRKYIHTLVVKVASRCNLNCTYCYMYNKGDSSFKIQPKVISDDVIDAILKEVVEHCRQNELTKFDIVLHGGEPLLAGRKKIQFFIDKAREITTETGICFNFSVQTNGLLLTKEWCEFFNINSISLGISIDGAREVNDRFRIDHKGKGSYDRIVKAIELANNHYTYEDLGLLSVLDVNSDPIDSFNHLLSLGVDSIEFLIPDHNYADLPVRPTQGKFVDSETPYGDWIITMYDHWNSLSEDQKPSIRLFSNLILKFCGIVISSDLIGNENNHVLVIETNGDIEPIDSLKICGENFTKGDVNITESSLDDAFSLNLANLYYGENDSISEKCNKCPIFEYCGSGFIAHRYSKQNGLKNPTIYCKDYIKFISHIQSSLVSELPIDLTNVQKIDALNYDEIVLELEIKNEKFY